MARMECPRCGQKLDVSHDAVSNDPYFVEARLRVRSQPDSAPQQRSEDDPIFAGRCRLCGRPLPSRDRSQRDDVLDRPTRALDDDEDYPTARPTSSQADDNDDDGEPHSTATHFLGLDMLGWLLVGGGFFAVMLLGGVLLVVILVPHTGNQPAATPTQPPTAQPQRQPPQPRRAGQPPAATQFPGLLAYWNLDEGDGGQAADSSGNGRNARLVNARWTQGVRGKALSLHGEGSYLDYSDSPRLSFAAGAPFTIAFWTRTQRGDGTLLSQRNSREGGAVIDILIKGGKVQAQVRQDGNDVSGPAIVNGGVVNDGSWHHVALARQGDAVELLLDGVSQDTTRGESAGGAITTDLRALGSERLWIDRHAPFGDPHFQGDMDEFCIFNRVLKAEEIKALAGR